MFQPIKLCFLLCSLSLTQGIHKITRQQWGAREPKRVLGFENPVPYVVIHHSGVDGHNDCKGEGCVRAVKGYQNYHMDNKKWKDIGYNFVVSPEGEIFEGTGWGIVGTHSPGYNKRSIGICIIGHYTNVVPTQKSLKATQDLIKEGVEMNKIRENYVLVGHRQINRKKVCPGNKLYDIIKTWPHWSVVNYAVVTA